MKCTEAALTRWVQKTSTPPASRGPGSKPVVVKPARGFFSPSDYTPLWGSPGILPSCLPFAQTAPPHWPQRASGCRRTCNLTGSALQESSRFLLCVPVLPTWWRVFPRAGARVRQAAALCPSSREGTWERPGVSEQQPPQRRESAPLSWSLVNVALVMQTDGSIFQFIFFMVSSDLILFYYFIFTKTHV